MTTASVFTGIKLSNESRSKLLDLTRGTFGDVLPNIKAQHITLHFRGSPKKIESEIMGKMVQFEVSYLVHRDGIQAVVLNPLGDARELNYAASHPHVTIAHDDGVKPSSSKKVIRSHPVTAKQTDSGLVFDHPEGVVLASNAPIKEHPLIISGQVGFVHDRHGWVFTHLSETEMVATPRA